MNFSMPNFSKKKLLLLGFLFVALLVIPLTVYLAQQQQDARSRADKTTTLKLTPASDSVKPGSQVSFDVELLPGTNYVSIVVLGIKFDSTKLTPVENAFELNPASGMTTLSGPEVEDDTVNVSLNFSDTTKVIKCDSDPCTPTKLGTLTFTVNEDATGQTQISFDNELVQIRSNKPGTADGYSDNVFLNGAPAALEITGDTEPTASPNPTDAPDPTTTISPTSTPDDITQDTDNENPVCEDLSADVATTGDAPYTTTFTAKGSDSDGTISKVSFNFGEGTVEDVTTGGGIGTATISASLAHTYNNGGEFTASAVLTDNNDGVSDSDSCTLTMTISGDQTDSSATVTPLPDTGPREAIVGVGAIGGILTVIGILLFFAL